MQMAISTTGRRPLCIFCSVSVLSKMLKLRSAEGSSFRLWWLLQSFVLKQIFLEVVNLLVVESASWCLLNAVSLLLLMPHSGARHQTHSVEYPEVRLFRWWACSGSNRLILCRLWYIRCLFLRLTTGHLETVIWVIEVIVRMLVSEWGHASPKTYVLMLLGIVKFINPFSIAYC